MEGRLRGPLFTLLLIAALLGWTAVPAAAAPPVPGGTIQVRSDLEMIGVGQLSGGGHVSWRFVGEQAQRLRQQILAFADEMVVIPPVFSNTPDNYRIHTTTEATRNSGTLEETEASDYADLLANYLQGLGSGFEYRYSILTAANRLQQGLNIGLSSSGLVDATNESTMPLELQFWFNSKTAYADVATALSETRFASAPQELFTVRYDRDFTNLGVASWPSTWPFDPAYGTGWAMNTTAPGTHFLELTSYVPDRSQNLWFSVRNPDHLLDLRFATSGTLTLEASADLGAGDAFRVEICPWDPYNPGCRTTWKALTATSGDRVGIRDFTGNSLATRLTLGFDLDAPANDLVAPRAQDSLIGQRYALRVNFTANADTTDDGQGIRIYRVALDAPAHAQGAIALDHADYILVTSNLDGWALQKGTAHYVRTPAGVVAFYSSTYTAEDPGADTVRYQAFSFFENPQILFGLVLACAWLQAHFMDQFYLAYRAKHPARTRATVNRVPWLTWLGRVLIIFMVLWYFFPSMFALFGLKAIIPGAFLFAFTVGGAVGMIVGSRLLYERMGAAIPAAPPAALCNHCFDPVTDPANRYACECGEVYHGHCAAGLAACPSCNRPVRKQATPAAPVPTVPVPCPSCGTGNKAPQGADLALERCVACSSPLKSLQRGYNYLVVAESSDPAWRWFNGLLTQGVPGLVLSTTFPEKLRREYTLLNAEMHWVSDTSQGGQKVLDPRRLDFEVMRAISNFVRGHRNGAVMLHGIEFLVVENGFDKVFKFVKKVNDLCSPNEVTLLVSVAPTSLGAEDLALLMKEFDKVEQLGVAIPPPAAPAPAPPAPAAKPLPPPPPKVDRL